MGPAHAPRQHGIARYFFIITCSLVAGVALAGFIIGGSPTDVRRKKYDELRIRDLQTIQAHVIEYWQRNGATPFSLAQVSSLQQKKIPIDPETNTEYFYRAKDSNQFELCATFNSETSSVNDYSRPFAKPLPGNMRIDRYEDLNNDWTHDGGYWCYSRIIDKDYYQLTNEIENESAEEHVQ